MNKINTVSTWEGRLVWVGTPRSGKSKSGREWKSVDFTLKYKDSQDQDRHITLNAFGVDRVDKILSAQIDTKVRVEWRPDSHEFNGKWYSKLEAYDVVVLDAEKEEPKRTELPKEAPLFKQGTEEETGTNVDLPF